MYEQRICPLLGVGPLGVNTNCKGDRCAWWDTLYCRCALLTLVSSVERLQEGAGNE